MDSPHSIDLKYYSRFERVTSVERTPHGVLIAVDNELLRIDVVRDDIVRLKMSRGCKFDEAPTHAVCADLENPVPKFDVEDDDAQVQLKTSGLTITVSKAPFCIDAHRADGSAIFESYKDEDGEVWSYATINDAFVVRRKCRTEDAFFGLGEKTGRFNRRGRDFTLWNTDVLNPNSAGEFKGDRTGIDFDPYYVSIPFFYHHTHDHLGCGNPPMSGMFVDNGYRARFEFSHAEEYCFHFSGGQYTEYVFAAPTMREILSAYTWLTGRMAAPPLWALGYHQCRWFRYTQEAVEALATRHREKQIPCDALWLDIEYMDGYRVFTWNDKTFPQPKRMLSKLREQGFRTISIIDPGVKVEPGYHVFDQAVERDVLCKTEGGDLYIGQVWPGKTAFPDFATPEGREWWGELNALHVQSGLAGIWNDMNEPATGDIQPDAMLFDRGRASHARYHNQYGLLMAMGTVEGLLGAMPDLRTFILTRAGSAGIQRYAANWMGDNCSRWDHLWLSLPMALGFGISGQPFVGADIGGFVEHSEPELFLRWMQCGVLTPFCRNHSNMGNVDQYAWAFGDVIEELCVEALRLRYRLLPYIYAAFMQSTQTGEPVQKPLVFEFQSDRTVRELDDQYLFGDSLLVAPVYKSGTTSRQVYLPEGTWYEWHSGEKFRGKRFIIAPTPMECIPIYARGGAVIPMWPEAPVSTDGYHPKAIELHVFVPEADGDYRSLLHEDDGLTFGFQKNQFLRTDFTLHKQGDRLKLEAKVSGEGYSEFARQEFHLLFHGAFPTELTLDSEALSATEGRFTIPNQGTSFVAEAELATSILANSK